jgi:hypothetical protein
MRLRTIWDPNLPAPRLAIVLVACVLASCDVTGPPVAGASAGPTTLPSTSPTEPPDGSPTPTANLACHDPHEHVYNPSRLVLRDPCRSVSGTIDDIRPESDGDYHVEMRLDSQFDDMLNDGNRSSTRGDLVLEVVCARRATGAAAIAACSGAGPSAALPRLNAHVIVTGAYVLDSHHGWMELHPIWDVRPG